MESFLKINLTLEGRQRCLRPLPCLTRKTCCQRGLRPKLLNSLKLCSLYATSTVTTQVLQVLGVANPPSPSTLRLDLIMLPSCLRSLPSSTSSHICTPACCQHDQVLGVPWSALRHLVPSFQVSVSIGLYLSFELNHCS